MKANESVHPVYNSVLYHNRGLLKWEQLAMDIYSIYTTQGNSFLNKDDLRTTAQKSIEASKIFFEELDNTK